MYIKQMVAHIEPCVCSLYLMHRALDVNTQSSHYTQCCFTLMLTKAGVEVYLWVQVTKQCPIRTRWIIVLQFLHVIRVGYDPCHVTTAGQGVACRVLTRLVEERKLTFTVFMLRLAEWLVYWADMGGRRVH